MLAYFHGGGFLMESAFSSDHHNFLNSLISPAQCVAVSVEYRPAYKDSWAALQWVASHPLPSSRAPSPMGAGKPSLGGLGCCRLLVAVAKRDELRDTGVFYYDEVRISCWEGEAELVQVDGEDHAFHVLYFESENAKNLIKHLASFLE